MKKLKLINSLITFILIVGCGYSPIYKDLSNINFSIKIKETIGDRKINNLFKSSLINYRSDQAEKKFDIDINTKYQKIIIAKDTTGAATEYKLSIDVSFKVESDDFEREYVFKENFNIKSISDKLEEQDYEDNVKSNLVNIITRKLILQLSLLK